MPSDSFQIQNGRVLRIEKRKPELSRSTIVASIGNPAHYPEKILDIDGQWIDRSAITYPFLVQRFFESGVDVIRVNFSHLDLNQMRIVFPLIKHEMLKCEGTGEGRKRMAILADLPGPKIRFHLKPGLELKSNQEFSVHFDKEMMTDDAATVYVGEDEPLKKALETLDRKMRILDIESDDDDEAGRQLHENTLGGTVPSASGAPNSYVKLLAAIENAANSEAGLRVVIGDGEVELKARRNGLVNNSLLCDVVSVHSQRLKPKAGFTLRGVSIDIPSFTDADQQILDALLELDYAPPASGAPEPVVAFIAVSFAQTAHDISQVKKYIEERLHSHLIDNEKEEVRQRTPSIIAKIETEKGYHNRKYILDVADGVMVARGDLGLQMRIEQVPAAQKKLIRLCNKRGKPVITATQLLKSMAEALEPTRAESTDVFNAITDGSDAVMMSEETSRGVYPFHAIRKMIAIAIEAERYHEYRGKDDAFRRMKVLNRIEGFLRDNLESMKENENRFKRILALIDREIAKRKGASDAKSREQRAILEWRQELYSGKWNKTMNQLNTDVITEAACKLSEREGIRCILAASTSGRTVRMISRLRPSVTIVGAAHDSINTRKVILSYGVLPICIPSVAEEQGTEGVFKDCEQVIRTDEFLAQHLLVNRATMPVIFTAGMPLRTPGTTNLIQVRDLRREAEQPKAGDNPP